jgi:hypothetical protein
MQMAKVSVKRATMARTSRERELIERFLQTLNVEQKRTYVVTDWPDSDSSAQNVDAIATDAVHGTLAIEHTVIQPFTGEKNDSAILLKGIGALDKKPSLIVPGYDVDLCFHVGAVPKGISWPSVADHVEAWYLAEFASLPHGRSTQMIPGLPFDLEVDVEKERGEGHFFISRWMPPDSVDSVVVTALGAKLPKLVAARSDRRLLLLEKDSLPRSPDEIGAAIERCRASFPDLERLDEAWVINTVAWPAEDYTPAYFVWPRPHALAWRRVRNLSRRRLRTP